ncbi:MAG TPA: NYN domain-containing protein [Ignavibacteriales bacterium]|nr:NYN domain-containing protein [Ignavibacteriales bacterium]
MKYVFIDGNNLIGYINKIKKIAIGREDLVFKLEKFYNNKKNQIIVFFDGFENDKIVSQRVKIIYSEKKSADDVIREYLEKYYNPKLVTLITSDLQLQQIGKVNSACVISSEDLVKQMYISSNHFNDCEKPNVMSIEEAKKLFGEK